MQLDDEGSNLPTIPAFEEKTNDPEPPIPPKKRRRGKHRCPTVDKLTRTSATLCSGEWLQRGQKYVLCEACERMTSSPKKLHAYITEHISPEVFDNCKLHKLFKIYVCMECSYAYQDDALLVKDVLDEDSANILFKVY